MDNTNHRISERLKVLRLEKGLTQSELAEKAAINTNYYAKVERGEATASVPMLEKIAEVLGVDISEIFTTK